MRVECCLRRFPSVWLLKKEKGPSWTCANKATFKSHKTTCKWPWPHAWTSTKLCDVKAFQHNSSDGIDHPTQKRLNTLMLEAAKRSCVFSACYEFIHCKCNDTKAIAKALIDWFKASRACPHPWEGLRYFLVKHCYLDILGLLLINHPLFRTPTNTLSEGNVSVRKTWKGTNITISTLIHGPSTPAANIEVLPASDASAWQAAVSEPPKGLLFCSEFRVWKVHLKLRTVTDPAYTISYPTGGPSHLATFTKPLVQIGLSRV